MKSSELLWNKDAWPAPACVVMPEYQGFGMGPKLCWAVGELFLHSGLCFYRHTHHPSMGKQRDRTVAVTQNITMAKRAILPTHLDRVFSTVVLSLPAPLLLCLLCSQDP